MQYRYTILGLLLLACNTPKQTTTPVATGTNALSSRELTEGWQLLFDGQTTSGWHTYGKPGAIGNAWKVEDGTLHFDAGARKVSGGQGGDIVTDGDFDNFHLKLEWKIAPRGNS